MDKNKKRLKGNKQDTERKMEIFDMSSRAPESSRGKDMFNIM